jgi:hypothetical protein
MSTKNDPSNKVQSRSLIFGMALTFVGAVLVSVGSGAELATSPNYALMFAGAASLTAGLVACARFTVFWARRYESGARSTAVDEQRPGQQGVERRQTFDPDAPPAIGASAQYPER